MNKTIDEQIEELEIERWHITHQPTTIADISWSAVIELFKEGEIHKEYVENVDYKLRELGRCRGWK